MALIVVKAAYDPEAGVWFVESSDLPGLNVEASTVEKLQEQVPLAVADLIEAAGQGEDFDIPIEIITLPAFAPRVPFRSEGLRPAR